MPDEATTPRPHVLIIAGDPSADRHGAALVESLKARRPDLRVTALGGDYLKSCADRFAYPLVGIGGFGFWEPIFKLPQLWDARKEIRRILKEDRPQVVVPMDYYGFNIHAARLAKAAKIPVFYYISPQVWASRINRIQALAKVVTKMLVIFPFEVELYKKANVPVAFVGHPLVSRVPSPVDPSPGINVGLLPGSRPSTIAKHLPIQVRAADLLHKAFPDARFLLFRPEELSPAPYEEAIQQSPWIRVVTDSDYRERSRLTLAISVSGTSALENMLLGIPMVIMYRLSTFTYEIAKRLIRIPYIGIPNILANRAVVPELIQEAATPEGLAAQAAKWIRQPELREKVRKDLLTLRTTLQGTGATTAADEILDTLATTRIPGNV